jgi:hypothetical protein
VPNRKRAVKPPVLLPLVEIRRVLQVIPEPTRSILVLIVFASMRPGEVLALRWKGCLPDRVVVDERVYDDEFDTTSRRRRESEKFRSISTESFSARSRSCGRGTGNSASQMT